MVAGEVGAVDLEEFVVYKMAFGLAADLAEADRQNVPGRWRSNAAAGGSAGTIMAEVLRRIPIEDPAGQEVVRAAVEDAPEGRRPKW